jgi:hypothetical protein
VSLSVVWNLREKGMSWVQVMTRLKVPHDRIFVEMPKDPGPPHGKAYGHWKKHAKNSKQRVEINDDDVFYWTMIRTQSRYFGVPAESVVTWREDGRTWKTIAAGEYRHKHGKRRVNQAGAAQRPLEEMSEEPGSQPPGHSKGKGHGSKN